MSPFHVEPIERCPNVCRRDGERQAAECVTPTFKSGFKTINVCVDSLLQLELEGSTVGGVTQADKTGDR